MDALRGFAAVWVVMDHSCDKYLATDMRYAGHPLYAFSIRGQLGVVLFFVISGYCIAAAAYGAFIKEKSVWRYAYERVRRIYPPYFTALMLGVLYAVLLDFLNARHIATIHHTVAFAPTWAYWFANLFLLQAEFGTSFVNVVFWSLCYEVSFYAIVGCWLYLARKSRRLSWLIYGVAFTTLAALAILIARGSSFFPFDFWTPFALGSMLFFLVELRRAPGITVLIATLFLIYAVLYRGVALDIGHPSSRVITITALLFFLFVLLLRPFDDRIASYRLLRPLLWLGACSYSLYLIHPLVIPFIDYSCRKVGLNGNLYWIAFWLQVVASIAAGRVFYYLVERHFVSKRQKQRLAQEKAA
jgi:peptidoglycan/LPS O-acetylase OafA/YrhL